MDDFPDVIGIGEILWDEYRHADGTRAVRLGGAPANFVYYAAEQGLHASLLSAVGQDAAGRAIGGFCYALGLPAVLAEEPQPTGRVLVQLDAAGVPSYEILPDVAWDHLEADARLMEYARHARVACFGSLAQRSRTTRETIRAFLRAMPQEKECWRIFDANLRCGYYSDALIHESLQLANVLKVNEEELPVIAAAAGICELPPLEQARQLMERCSLQLLILTCGAAGSHVLGEGGRQHSYLAAPEVRVRDTVGAGDSFTAGFIAGILQGCSLPEAHAKAVALAARVCTRCGALPTPEELVLADKHSD